MSIQFSRTMEIIPINSSIICPACLKRSISVRARLAESPPIEDKLTGNLYQNSKIIGHVYYHNDGAICDVTIFKLEKLQKPLYLRLGDPERDPRV